jgi:hypothetical protein
MSEILKTTEENVENVFREIVYNSLYDFNSDISMLVD